MIKFHIANGGIAVDVECSYYLPTYDREGAAILYELFNDGDTRIGSIHPSVVLWIED